MSKHVYLFMMLLAVGIIVSLCLLSSRTPVRGLFRKYLVDQVDIFRNYMKNENVYDADINSSGECRSCEEVQSSPGPRAAVWQQEYRDFINFMDAQNRLYVAVGGFAMFALRCGGYSLQKDLFHDEPWRGLFGKSDSDFDFRMIAHNESDRDRLWETARETFTSWKWTCWDWRDAGGWGCFPPDWRNVWDGYHYFFQVFLDDSPDGNGTHFLRSHKPGVGERIPKSRVFPTASAKMYNVTVPVAR